MGLIDKLFGRIAARATHESVLQDYLDLLPDEFRGDSEQSQLIEKVLTQLQEMENSDDKRKLLVVISGGPGTGKSVVAETILLIWSHMRASTEGMQAQDIPYENYGAILLQGQTFDRRHREIRRELKKCLAKWSGKLETRERKRSWARDIVILDEAHLAPPLRYAGAGNQEPMNYHWNKRDLDARRVDVEELARGTHIPRQTEQGKPGEYELLLPRAAQEAGKCLIVIRDPSQVHGPVAMSNDEFALSVSAILGVDCYWDPGLDRVLPEDSEEFAFRFISEHLTTQHRTSEIWASFIRDLFRTGEIDLKEVGERYGKYLASDTTGYERFVDNALSKSATGASESVFTGYLMHDASSFIRWVRRQQEHAKFSDVEAHFRVLSTYSWKRDALIDLDGNSRHILGWAPDAYPVNEEAEVDTAVRTRKYNDWLAEWPRKDKYDVAKDGVGYIASCQNQDFDGVGAIIGTHLKWVPTPDTEDSGHWVVDENAWMPFIKASPEVRRQLSPEAGHGPLIEKVLAEARVLLTRPVHTVGVYFCDRAARDAFRTIGFRSVGRPY